MPVLVVSGIRDLAPESIPDVEMGILEHLPFFDEVRFGGARGVDTVALRAAHDVTEGLESPVLIVYAPATLKDLPKEGRTEAERSADRIVELGGHPAHKDSYLKRNLAMLNGASRLLAFWDGGTGGTAFTIREAEKRGIPVTVIAVNSTDAVQPNPMGTEELVAKGVWRLRHPAVHMPLYALGKYRGRGRQAEWREWIKLNKLGEGDQGTFHDVVQGISQAILAVPSLRLEALLPMPRRQLGVPSSLELVCSAVAGNTGQAVAHRVLRRAYEPKDTYISKGRRRNFGKDHANSYDVVPDGHESYLVIDDVVTNGGSMEGARLALRWGGVGKVAGLAILRA